MVRFRIKTAAAAVVTGSGPVAALERALAFCNNVIVVFAGDRAGRGVRRS